MGRSRIFAPSALTLTNGFSRLNGGGESLSDDIDQLFELTRIIVLVLAGLLPNLTESKSEGRDS